MCTVSAPPPPPTNVIAESATMDNVSSIVVRWDPPQPVPDNLQYKVYFAAVDESGYQPQGEVVFRICDATQTSASITDLSPRAHYQVRVGTVAGVVTESSSTPQVIETPDISKLCVKLLYQCCSAKFKVPKPILQWTFFILNSSLCAAESQNRGNHTKHCYFKMGHPRYCRSCVFLRSLLQGGWRWPPDDRDRGSTHHVLHCQRPV